MHSVGMSFCSRGCGRGMVHIAKQSQASSPDSVLSCLATTYLPSPSRDKYSRRWRSSRPCSGWVRVFPLRYGHQTRALRLLLAHTASAFGLQMCSLGTNSASAVLRATLVLCSFVLALTWLWLLPAGVLTQNT